MNLNRKPSQPRLAASPSLDGPSTSSELTPAIGDQQRQLVDFLARYTRCLVAFSGGVDSAVVAKAACLALGDKAQAVMAVSDSIASGEVELATKTARQIGIAFQTVETDEMSDPDYRANTGRRCYHCKTELYSHLQRLRSRYPDAMIVSGANRDDLDDYRPGLQAAAEANVVHPLAEIGLGKSEVRAVARAWGLDVWDKPAMPCLSSRIAYGQEVTPKRLRMVDLAESRLKELGFELLRVRYHSGDMARIEVRLEDLPRIVAPQIREAILQHFQSLGFRFVTLDLAGFQSGSLNQLIQISPSHELQL